MKSKLFLLTLFFITTSFGQILPLKERADKIDELLKDRFENVLPQLMDQSEIDMWIIISREYNEDPVLKTMLPATWLNARRRTVLVFFKSKDKNEVERLAVARYNVGDNINSAWKKEEEPDQWQALFKIIKDRNPTKIGLNQSAHFALADGLVKSDYEWFTKKLPENYKQKIVSAEKLAIAWIETRTEKEMEVFKFLSDLTHKVIAEAFSAKVITPGKTSTQDVVWYMRQKLNDLGLKTWFHPTVDIQRSQEALVDHVSAFSDGTAADIIQKGDLIHCDFGITYLRLNTDCQQHAYVLKDGESQAPDFLVAALAKGNAVQDHLTTNFVAGKSGNDILAKALAEAKTAGLQPSIYTHPLGTFGHSAGPTIGMWDSQQGVPIRGDYPLRYNTAYAIELNTTVAIPAWKRNIRIMLEEPGFFGKDGFRYIAGRQEKLLLVGSD